MDQAEQILQTPLLNSTIKRNKAAVMWRIAFFIFCLLFLSTLPQKSFSAEAFASLRVAIVDVENILNTSLYGEQVKVFLNKEFGERKNKLDDLEVTLQSLKADLDAETQELSEQAVNKKREKYRKLYLEVNQRSVMIQQEMNAMETRLTEKVMRKIKAEIKAFGLKEHFDLILEESGSQVLFAKDARNITEEVKTLLDKKFRQERK